ncbi:MAG: TetR/AcrR family transcriptional regulator [Parvibaculum sp.]|jgi:AcrR family transcriptional regulator|uniref:TetR/AcrR family transcriptional regulator n=1 Tax=Parvibaculum sp. TaxID=2024848 RepID=UPI0028403D41|nr:TetR/AcrR family transcriptional regulator [Parvibaculum sp.]MDR3498447.1 TetR/AcrR family transcriptional regulator [Parvibaculum sp.]
MTSQDDTRQKIINAAKERFAHYGYGKTTMADLADDTQMSPGNLYRYFPGKLDIAEEIAREASIRTAEQLSRILTRPGRSASERLHDFLFEDLRETFQTLERDPKLVEMAQIITAERPHFHNEGQKREREVLRRIVEYGNVSGEFSVADPEFVAEMIQSATLKFSYPQLFTRLPLARLERELEGVFQILVAGLKAGVSISEPHRDVVEA